MPDYDNGLALDTGETADQRLVVGIHAVAMKLLEVRKAARDVVERVGTKRMSRELRHLPRSQPGEDAFRQRIALATQTLDFLADVELRIVADELELVDLRLELSNGLFKIEKLQIHACENFR